MTGPRIRIHPEVADALTRSAPVVALETAVLTHGLPRSAVPSLREVSALWSETKPANLALAMAMESEVRAGGCVPATCAVIKGELVVGLAPEELASLASMSEPLKLSARDLAPAIANGSSGGLTVAATLSACAAANIRVFATGGIGGVHRGWNRTLDISADLAALARISAVTVCAGAKSILDLPATLEALDSLGVPVIGMGTRHFPCFSSPPDPSLPLPSTVENPESIAPIARAHWSLGHRTGVLAVQPCPAEHTVPRDEFEKWFALGEAAAKARGVRGPEVTPFLLAHLAELSGGRTLRANVALLLANARAAAAIARRI
ncbi:MAG: pseudouridine-5'-phosphate glycosidase [Planctomycetes bacterium]|nr:pseudouridine-5'-phosphate glycosidase [Planctomycetota bacterium]